jgi:hypothetical protein
MRNTNAKKALLTAEAAKIHTAFPRFYDALFHIKKKYKSGCLILDVVHEQGSENTVYD